MSMDGDKRVLSAVEYRCRWNPFELTPWNYVFSRICTYLRLETVGYIILENSNISL